MYHCLTANFRPAQRNDSLETLRISLFLVILLILTIFLGERECGTEGKLLLLAKENGTLKAVDVHSRDKVQRFFLFYVISLVCIRLNIMKISKFIAERSTTDIHSGTE